MVALCHHRCGLRLFSVYIWKPRHGLFVRTGVVNLYIDVRDYFRGSRRYRTGMEQRLSDLSVTRNAEGGKPHTVLLVIGESACRDYMSAFEPDQPWETTPWETAMSRDRRHFSFSATHTHAPCRPSRRWNGL